MSDSTKLLRELVELVQVCPPLLADIEVSYFAVLHGRLLLCHQQYSIFITYCNSHKSINRDPCLVWKVYYIA